MNQFSDQILARRMLEMRDRGYSFALFLRRNSKRFMILFAYFGLASIVVALIQFWTLFYVLLGMLAGCLLRDIGWFLSLGKTWAFTLKVIDWDKVQILAEEKDAA